MNKIIKWTRNNWLGLVLLAIVSIITITFGWWSYCCAYNGEVGLAITCCSILLFFIPIVGLYLITLMGKRVSPNKEKIITMTATIAIIGCCLGLSNSCQAQQPVEREYPTLIKEFVHIVHLKDIDEDITDVYNETILSDTTYEDGRNWRTVVYELNNSTSRFVVNTFTYLGETTINYIDYETNNPSELREAVKWLGAYDNDGFLRTRNSYVIKERQLNGLPLSEEDFIEHSVWQRKLKSGKWSLFFTTLLNICPYHICLFPLSVKIVGIL